MSKHNRERKRLFKLGLTERQRKKKYKVTASKSYITVRINGNPPTRVRLKARLTGEKLYEEMRKKTGDNSIGVHQPHKKGKHRCQHG
jgi:hypothetical protein